LGWKNLVLAKNISFATDKTFSGQKKFCFGRIKLRHPKKHFVRCKTTSFSAEKILFGLNKIFFGQKKSYFGQTKSFFRKKCFVFAGQNFFCPKKVLFASDETFSGQTRLSSEESGRERPN